MANVLYDKGRQKFADKLISWTADDIKLVLVTGEYTCDIVNDEYLSVISTSYIAATSANLSEKGSVAGVCSCASVTFSAVPAGNPITSIVCYKDTGDRSTSPLIAYCSIVTGLPKTPDGSNIVLNFDPGSNKFFKL